MIWHYNESKYNAKLEENDDEIKMPQIFDNIHFRSKSGMSALSEESYLYASQEKKSDTTTIM